MDLITPDLVLFYSQIVILVTFVVPAVFFLLAQYKTLKTISPANREMSPGEVWFQLIPIFNLYWQFVVVTRIADSLLKEQVFLESQDDSILGIPDFDAVEAVGNRPTYKIGMAWCTLFLLDIIAARLQWFAANYVIVQGLLGLSAMICWIVYWVELVKNKRKILHLRKPVA
ncbi:MAG TPA: hypothetical protein VK518_25075 [Puia sp.]|nr:hypothetical protein [Puia sp.]